MTAVDKAATQSSRALPAVAEISREIVRVYSAHHGRGPTRAKTVWRDEVVICVLHDVLTKPERMLVDAGRFEQVRTNRLHVRDVTAPLLRQAVERATGSTVRTHLGQVGADGAASEVFLL